MAGNAGRSEVHYHFDELLDDLNVLFSKRLWEAKMESRDTCWKKVRVVKDLKSRDAVIVQQLRQWEDQTIGSIKEFFPHYLSLAGVQPELQGDEVRWAAGRVWDCLEKNYGISRVSRTSTCQKAPALTSDQRRRPFDVLSSLRPGRERVKSNRNHDCCGPHCLVDALLRSVGLDHGVLLFTSIGLLVSCGS